MNQTRKKAEKKTREIARSASAHLLEVEQKQTNKKMASSGNSAEHPSSVLTRFEVNQAGAETNAVMASMASKATAPSSSANAATAAASAAASVTSYHHSRQTSLPASMNIQQQQQQVGNNSNHVHFQNDLILRHQHQRVTQHQQLSDHHQNLSKQKFPNFISRSQIS